MSDVHPNAERARNPKTFDAAMVHIRNLEQIERDLTAKLQEVQAWADKHIPHVVVRSAEGMPYANVAIRAIIEIAP